MLSKLPLPLQDIKLQSMEKAA